MFAKEDGSAILLLEGPNLPNIPPVTISASGVTKLKLKLKVQKASDPDNIPACVLKELAEPLSACLAAFFSLSLQWEVPMNWKTAYIQER